MNTEEQYTLLNHCPICDRSELVDFLRTKDFTFSGEMFTIQKCVNCGFRFTNPIPSEDQIGRYYGAENYMSHATKSKRGLMPFVYKRVRNINLNNKLSLVREYANGNKLLDIGAGNGFFLKACEIEQYEVLGVELDEKARKVAFDDFGLELQDASFLAKTESHSIDVITMWHVLEHVYQLKEQVALYERILKPDGVLIIALPNIDSYDAHYYKEYWDGLDLPLHLYHFTPKDVRRLFEQFDMEVVDMRPMRFDAYWVSMNSEKFKGGSLLRAFYIGLKSNLKAKNGKYSSQIYVIKKKTALEAI